MRYLLILFFMLLACGDIEKELEDVFGDNDGDVIVQPEPEPMVSPSATTTPTPEPKPSSTPRPTKNPVCKGVQSFRDGAFNDNLWKPEGEHTGTPVFLLDNKYRVPFNCKVIRKNGKKEQARFTGFSNGDRQTHRIDIGCERVKPKSKVECKDKRQTCSFKIPGNPCNRHD